MWSDNETSEDLFGFRIHSDLIRELILDPTVLPVTIGVFGDWGGGKSSIMQMLNDDLEARQEEDGVATLYFNGWLFEGYDDAKAALLSSILTSLRDHKRFGPKLRDTATRLLKRVDYMRGARILLSGAVAGGLAAATGGLGLAAAPAIMSAACSGAGDNALDAAKESISGVDETQADEALSDIRQFRDDFANMLKASDIKTLVVIIDDLDRCSPERIIENLEAIKLFLNVPNTAFVIGADRRIISQAVAWRYRDTLPKVDISAADGSERLVEDYLEKLIQIPYSLPRLSPSEIETYLILLFCKRHMDEGQFAQILQASEDQRLQDRHQSFAQTQVLETLGGKCSPELSKSMQIGSSIAGQITDVLQGNPRQVKRFLNAFFLRRKLADVAKLEDVSDDILVKLMLLEYAAPKLFQSIFQGMDGETGAVPILTECEALIQKGKLAEELPSEWRPYARWLAYEPYLSHVDLRNYMWVTRDRLRSTMSSAVMVPTIVRAFLKQLLSNVGDARAREELKNLQPDELDILYNLLENHVQQKPREMKAFQALITIAGGNPTYVPPFGALIERLPKSDLSPALAVTLVTISKKRTPLGACAKKIINDSGKGTTQFEKALAKANK
ncbi:MAG: NTPase [Puniceicoccaceae bacterium]|nr:NTPase [Puniceicoccaceae bacterium]|tara:strand:- start:2759 stop:4606 length:1848 start_codon:yes stop_codon:yes gene_type:complete